MVVMCICARSWVILFHERWCAAALRQVHSGLLWTFCSSMFHRYLGRSALRRHVMLRDTHIGVY